MEWFSQGVADAIATCRRLKSLFIVYIHDDSVASSHTTDAWNDESVCQVLSTSKAVAIKVVKNSPDHQQFAQLYPVFVFPSAFCIGLKGQPLVVMNGRHSVGQIRGKLSEALKKLQREAKEMLVPAQATPMEVETTPTSQNQSGALPSDSESHPQPVSSSSLSFPQPPPPTSTSTTTSSTGGLLEPSASELPGPSSFPSSSSSAAAAATGEAMEEEAGEMSGEGEGEMKREESREEKLERAKQVIRQKRQEKAEAEFEKEKGAELKRRQEGKQLDQFQREQEIRRNQNWMEERKKAKLEDRRAREAVKAKLRQDQLEREAARKAKEHCTSTGGQGLRQRSSQATSTASSSVSTGTGLCRLQLRLPNGTKSVIEMRAEDSLATLREKVAQELGSSPENTVLINTYPRRELTADLEDQTLAELQLAPSGVVAVRVKQQGMGLGGGKSNSAWSLWGAVMGIFQLILDFLVFLKNTLAGLFGVRGGDSGQGQQETTPTTAQQRWKNSDGRVRQFRPGDYETETDDDDERRNTYNGNSTEQQ